MYPIIILMIIMIIIEMWNFPGGPRGMLICGKVWLKRKGLTLVSKTNL